MQDAHQGCNHLTVWLCPDIKKELNVHFGTDEGFKRHYLTNRTNRASPRSSKYTGGSATFMKTKSRLSKLLECEPTLAETFKYNHRLKANKERFVDERSAAHYEDYTQRLEAMIQQSQLSGDDPGSDASVIDPNKAWCETVSELYKNCVYRLGSFFVSGLRTSTLMALSASASTTSLADPTKVVDLREEMQKLTQELHQQAQQYEERYNELLACMKDTIAISSKLTKRLERLKHLRDLMAVYNEQMYAGGSGCQLLVGHDIST
ncbi:hypothetical protein Ahy_A03g012730 [Arachis hypogaea]|uniref:Uncharacterized protein n=1 Tax=Arachis hypogaea TaxID=3818 RepID=A0A445DU82_ARAHY|nr:hypothetical protein Ahy_A03g012730 [Arachis hypogaea]